MKHIDEPRLTELITESQDLQVDALRRVPEAVAELHDLHASGSAVLPTADELVTFNRGRREFVGGLDLGSLVSRGVMAAGFASALGALLAKPALADTNLDIQILQTASSLEVLAVATYGAALGLPFIANGNPVVKAFATTTMNQHDQHRQAFQAQSQALGGRVQTTANPKYAPVVEQAKPTLQAPADVVKLAMTLEQVATDTYLSDLAQLADTKSKQIMASVMGVESQHLATLRAVAALLAANLADLIAIPTDVAKLPAAAGSVGFPNPTEGTALASPAAEGAVR